MRAQIKVVELPFNQLELMQLECLLNKERKADWVLVKVEGNKLYFEKRPGMCYCYQVQLHIIPQKLKQSLYTIGNQQKQFVKRADRAGNPGMMRR